MSEEPRGGGKPVLKVRRGSEEHVPICQKKGQPAYGGKLRGPSWLASQDGKCEGSYQAQSIDIPRRRNMEYSSDEKGCFEQGFGWPSSAPESEVRG